MAKAEMMFTPCCANRMFSQQLHVFSQLLSIDESQNTEKSSHGYPVRMVERSENLKERK